MPEELSVVLQYTRILHQHGGKDSKEARDFYEVHRGDATFRRQAEVLHRLMKARSVPAAVAR